MKSKSLLDYRCLVLTCAIALAFVPTTALAAPPASGNGQAIKDAVTGVLAKTDTLTTTLGDLCDVNCQSTKAGSMYHGRVTQMQNAQGRANKANGRTTAADYGKMNRKNGKKKSTDGCDPDTQICVADTDPLTPVTVSATANEPEIDEDTGKDTIQDLDDVGSNVDQLNTILSGNAPPTPPTVYSELDNAEYFFPESMWPSPKVVLAAFIADQAAEKASAIATHFCEQDAVALGEGGNGSSACAAVEGVYQVLNTTYEMMEFIVRERADAEITGAYEREGNIYKQLLGTGGDINTIKTEVEAMGKELLIIEKNQEYLMQLVTTPQGRRPGFPTGGGASAEGTTSSSSSSKGH